MMINTFPWISCHPAEYGKISTSYSSDSGSDSDVVVGEGEGEGKGKGRGRGGGGGKSRRISQTVVRCSTKSRSKVLAREDIKDGDKLDVCSLLSSSSRDYLVDKQGNQVKVSSIKGKFILIQCFMLPVNSFKMSGKFCWALKSACTQWSNFQLVLALKIKKRAINDSLQLFNSFLSAFPSCLAIPLEDSDSFRRVRKLVPYPRSPLLLDPTGLVLTGFSANAILEFGADAYPFTAERYLPSYNLEFIVDEDERPPLEVLLRLRLSDRLSNTAANDHISVSHLKTKVLGLYLCRNAKLMDMINQICQGKNDREFEVVLVYIPVSDDPQHFIACIDNALRAKGISSWWVCPFDDTASRYLWFLCDFPSTDQLIVVGPNAQYLEYRAARVIAGISTRIPTQPRSIRFDLYPFAAEALARQETDRLQKLTLYSLLCPSTSTDNHLICLLTGEHKHVRELQGKNVFLFIIDCGYYYCFKPLEDMRSDYREVKGEKDSDSELVFVPLHSTMSKLTGECKKKFPCLWDSNFNMSWLLCPPDPAREASIIKHTTIKGLPFSPTSHAAFGKDGRMFSIASPSLLEPGAGGSLRDRLYDDVLEEYNERLSFEWPD